MTMLTDLNQLAGGDNLPAFKFKRIGDAAKGKVLRSSLVTRPDPESKRDKTSLAVSLELVASKGGIVDSTRDDDGLEQITISDYQPGDQVTVWLNPGFGIGAIRDALTAAGATSLEDGATLTIKLIEKRDTGKKSPANVFEAKYEPPSGGVSIDEL